MSDLPYAFSIQSDVPLSAPVVWSRVSTFLGVNYELMPWLRMTVPSAMEARSVMEAPLGEPIFASWLLFAGVLPIDRHIFQLEEAEEGRFLERSSSWLHAVWRHERRVVATETGCRVSDELQFCPRLRFLGHLVLPIVRAVFAHRHRRLCRWARR